MSEILYNRLTDEDGGRASYELECPNGGEAVVVGNIIQQSLTTENSNLIAFGQEGYKWPINRLYLTNNTILNDHPHGGTFVRARASADKIVSANNFYVGRGVVAATRDFKSINDVRGDWGLFTAAGRYEYMLTDRGRKHLIQSFAIADDEGRTTPKLQYRHRASTQNLASAPRFVGAVQQ